jgi:hypothetical protein
MPLGSSKRGAPLLLVFQYVHALTSNAPRGAGCDLRVIGARRPLWLQVRTLCYACLSGDTARSLAIKATTQACVRRPCCSRSLPRT